MDKFYSSAPDGYCGDEDNGQTSAWYVFSAMGFYPVCPASAQYAIGSPLFRTVTVSLPDGKKIEIKAGDNSEQNVYISSMKVDGKKYSRNYLEHSDLVKGTSIEFRMASEPDKSRGTAAEDRPYSLSLE